MTRLSIENRSLEGSVFVLGDKSQVITGGAVKNACVGEADTSISYQEFA